MTTLPHLCQIAAIRWPDRPALKFDGTGETIDYRRLDSRTDDIARGLITLGIRPGDRIAVCMGNRLLYPLAWLATIKAGAVMVPINCACRHDDARHLIRLTQPVAAFCDAHSAPLLLDLQGESDTLRWLVSDDTPTPGVLDLDDLLTLARADAALPACYPEQLTNIQFTSGTTGLPKGCMLTHSYWIELGKAIQANVIALDESDSMLMAQAFSYLDPQWSFVTTLLSGSCLVVLDRFRAQDTWEKMNQYGITFFCNCAAMPLMLLANPVHPSERSHKLKVVMCSLIPPDRHQELEQRFGVPWIEAYGSTETGFDIGVALADHPGSVASAMLGKALRHREALLLDEQGLPVPRGTVGELALRGTGMMLGYWQQPQATADSFRAGWYHTGDLARQDADGNFYLVGRIKDMIRRAGENIACVEVEQALQEHSSVALAACIGVPDPIRNEEIKVFVILREPCTAQSLALFLEKKLARFKVPRYWQVVSELPMTPSLRVAKPMLSRHVDGDVHDRTQDTAHQKHSSLAI